MVWDRFRQTYVPIQPPRLSAGNQCVSNFMLSPPLPLPFATVFTALL
jgi:hypothetical protein